jgi:hypothetical protein
MDVNEKYWKTFLEPRNGCAYDENKETLYLIEGASGTYDLYSTFPICIKKTLESAQQFITKHEEWKERTEELAVKDDHETGNLAYCKLQDDYNDYIFSLLFPGKKPDAPMTDEDAITYDDYFSDDENFIKFMTVVKGFSKEKAQATLDYNSDECSEFNTTYSIYKINLED